MNAADLHSALVARLRTLPSLTVYDSDVPKTPPADENGLVYPYAVVWATPGHLTTDQDSLDGTDGNLLWNPRVTVAAGQTLWLLRGVGAVRSMLHGWRPVPGFTLHEQEGTPTAQADETVAPRRWYVPMTFETLVG